MQIGGEGVEILLMNMVLEKIINFFFGKDTLPCLFTWEWGKQILIWNYPSDIATMTYNL